MKYSFNTQKKLSPKNTKILKNDLMKMLWSITVKGIKYDSFIPEDIEILNKKRLSITILQLLDNLKLLEDNTVTRTDVDSYVDSVFTEYFLLIEDIDDLGILIENDKEYKIWLNRK